MSPPHENAPHAPRFRGDPGTGGPVETQILGFLRERTGTEWGLGDDLFAAGAVSSLFALQLVVYLEQAFGVAIGGDDLTIDNFRSVRAMSELIGRMGAG